MCVAVLSQYRMSSEGNLVKAKVEKLENSDSDDHSSASRKGGRSSESSDS